MKLAETKRFILRAPKEGDEKDISENLNDLDVSKYLATVSHPYNVSYARTWIKFSRMPTCYDKNFVMEASGRVIGSVALSDINSRYGSSYINYWLGKKHWRQGIMSEALDIMLGFAFTELHLDIIQAEVFEENEASRKMLEKLGFKENPDKKRIRVSTATDKMHDTLVYEMMKRV